MLFGLGKWFVANRHFVNLQHLVGAEAPLALCKLIVQWSLQASVLVAPLRPAAVILDKYWGKPVAENHQPWINMYIWVSRKCLQWSENLHILSLQMLFWNFLCHFPVSVQFLEFLNYFGQAKHELLPRMFFSIFNLQKIFSHFLLNSNKFSPVRRHVAKRCRSP